MDIAYLLSTYELIPAVRDALYEADNTEIMETYGWDITQASAFLLGQHAKHIAQTNTRQEIIRLADGKRVQLNLDHLAEEMCEYIDIQYETSLLLLAAFMPGFNR